MEMIIPYKDTQKTHTHGDGLSVHTGGYVVLLALGSNALCCAALCLCLTPPLH